MCGREGNISYFCFFLTQIKKRVKVLSINFLNFKQTILSAIYLILIIDLSFFDYSSEHHHNPFIKFMHCSSSFCFVWLSHTVSLHTCIFILNIMSFILFFFFLLLICVLFSTHCLSVVQAWLLKVAPII